MHRRTFLTTLAATGAWLASSHESAAAPAPKPALRRPRKLVQFFVPGGFDSLYSFDPKTHAEADSRLFVPYRDDEITQIGNVRIGPLVKGLERFVDRMAIVRGVQCFTISHPVGGEQITHMSRRYSDRSPSLVNSFGRAVAPDAPIHDVQFFRGDRVRWKPRQTRTLFAGSQGELLHGLAAMAAGSRGARSAADDLRALVAAGELERSVAVDAAVAFMDKFPKAAMPPPPDTVSEFRAGFKGGSEDQARERARPALESAAITLQAALFVLKYDLAPTVFVNLDGAWDRAHYYNDQWQRICFSRLVPTVAAFLRALDTTTNAAGVPLSEEVGIVLASEMGRFPFINTATKGKDHFPELTAIVIGPGIRPGQYGDTDGTMTGRPVSLATGRPTAGHRLVNTTIDDLGKTLLAWAGLESKELGMIEGNVLDFLLA